MIFFSNFSKIIFWYSQIKNFNFGGGGKKFWKKISHNFLTVGLWADVKNGFRWKNYIALKVGGGQVKQKILTWNLAESICWKISLFFKNVPKHIGNELTTTKQRWTESSCVLCKLVQHIPFICHPKPFGQCYNKIFVIFFLFCRFFQF